MNENHIGSGFDDFLEEEGLLVQAESVAIKRVIAYQISQMMAEMDSSSWYVSGPDLYFLCKKKSLNEIEKRPQDWRALLILGSFRSSQRASIPSFALLQSDLFGPSQSIQQSRDS